MHNLNLRNRLLLEQLFFPKFFHFNELLHNKVTQITVLAYLYNISIKITRILLQFRYKKFILMTIFQHFSEVINSATNFITFIIIVRDKVLIKYIITMLTIHKRNRFPIEKCNTLFVHI